MWGMQAALVASLSLLVELSVRGGERKGARLGSRSRGQKRGEEEKKRERLGGNGRRQARFFLDNKERGDYGDLGKLLFRPQFPLNKILGFELGPPGPARECTPKLL